MKDFTPHPMSAEDIKQIDFNKGFIKVTIDFSGVLNPEESSTNKDFKDNLEKLSQTFGKTAIGDLLSLLQSSISAKVLPDSNSKLTLNIGECGGCGCSSTIPCHVLCAGECPENCYCDCYLCL